MRAVILDFEKYYFNFIYTIPADKGILCAVKATLKIPLTKMKDNLMVWLLIDNKKKNELCSFKSTKNCSNSK